MTSLAMCLRSFISSHFYSCQSVQLMSKFSPFTPSFVTGFKFERVAKRDSNLPKSLSQRLQVIWKALTTTACLWKRNKKLFYILIVVLDTTKSCSLDRPPISKIVWILRHSLHVSMNIKVDMKRRRSSVSWH